MLYIIGGNPCSGKSTIAKLFGEKYHLDVIDSDRLIEKIVSESTEKWPRLYEWKTQNILDILQKPAIKLFEEYIAFYKEALACFLKHIPQGDVIIEGAFFIPDILKDIKVDYKIIYLISSDAFYNKTYINRAYAKQMSETRYGQIALAHLMERDRLFQKYLIRSCNKANIQSLQVNEKTNVFDTIKAIEDIWFKLI